MIACLHQIRVIDYRRLQSLIGEIDTDDFQKVKNGLKILYDFYSQNSPPIMEERGKSRI